MTKEKGSASMILVLFITLSLLISALVIDFALVFIGNHQLRTAAEAASLAGALSAELIVEAVYDEGTEEVTYKYYASIVPQKAMQSAAEVISAYTTQGGLLKTIQISEINYEYFAEGGLNVKYSVALKGTQRALFPLWPERNFNVKRQSEAKLDFRGEG